MEKAKTMNFYSYTYEKPTAVPTQDGDIPKPKDESLATHDPIYHPDGFNPETDTCTKRDNLNAEADAKGDDLGGAPAASAATAPVDMNPVVGIPTATKELSDNTQNGEQKNESPDHGSNGNEGTDDEFRGIQEAARGLSAEDTALFHGGRKRIDDGLRTRLAEVFGRRLGRANDGRGYGKQLLTNPRTGEKTNILEDVSADDFHDIFEIVQKYLRSGDAVDVHSTEDYASCHNYLADDGMSGFSITQDGDLISVFSLGRKGWTPTIAPIVREKAKTLDCFNSAMQNLPNVYQKAFGFKTASILPFNRAIMEQYNGKDYTDRFVATYGEAPVHFMVNDHGTGTTEAKTFTDYDEAKNYQVACANAQ